MRFKNYINRYNKKNRIYSEEELLGMTLNDLLDNEPTILAQDLDIGIPTIEELKNSPNTHWIDLYTNEQGQKDGGFYGSINDNYLSMYPNERQLANENTTPVYNEWDYADTSDLDEYLDKDIINIMPENKKQEYEASKNQNNVLEGMVEKNANIIDKISGEVKTGINDTKSKIKQTINKYEGLSPMSAAQKAASKILPYKGIENEYYRNSLKMKDGEPLTDKFLEENDIYTLKDITDPEKNNYYKEQLAKMYGYDVNSPDINDLLKDKKIVVPKESSRLYQYAKNSEAFEKWIVDNYDRIKNGEKPLEDSVEFSLGGKQGAVNTKRRGLFATIHKANVNRYKINDDGSMLLIPEDEYNFEEWDEEHDDKNIKEKVENAIYNRYVNINNRAHEQQEANQLEPFLTSMPIYYTKEEVEEMLKRKNKKLYK